MVAKLRSILRPTHWSLLVKAIIFGVLWLFLPYPLFLIGALYLYLIPVFRPVKMALPFLGLIVLSGLVERGFFIALAIGATYYIIDGIKDLIFIRRRMSYEILVFLIMFIGSVGLYSQTGWLTLLGVIWSFVLSVFAILLLRELSLYGDPPIRSVAKKDVRVVVFGLVGFFVWQLSIVLFILPLGSMYQAAILFLTSAVLIEIAMTYLSGELTRNKLLINFTVLFIFMVFVIASNNWGL